MHKVIIIGDSHTKGLASSPQSTLNNAYKLFNLVKPGSNSNILKESAKEIISHLSNDDLLVISNDTNDLNLDNFATTYQNIRNYIMSINHTNILPLGIPSYPAVNTKILSLNKKLQKLTRTTPHDRFLDTNNDRKLFTTHELHRNKLGKQLVTS
jgi:hypothetical protein